MADQPKRKKPSEIHRNDNRNNGKANKQQPTDFRPGKAEWRGSHTRKTPLTYLQKTLLGGGAMVVAKQMDRRARMDHPDKSRSRA